MSRRSFFGKRSRQSFRAAELLEPRTLMALDTAELENILNIAALDAAYDPATAHLWVVNNNLDLVDLSNGATVTNPYHDFYGGGMAISGGHAYLSDAAGGIIDVTLPSSGTDSASILYVDMPGGNDDPHVPVRLTVSSGAVWFTTVGVLGNGINEQTNYIGRLPLGATEASFETLSVTDAAAIDITPNTAGGAWVGLSGLDDGVSNGANHLLSIDFSTGSFITTVVPVASGDAVADLNNHITSVASDLAGGVWYTLAQVLPDNTYRTEFGAERIVHLNNGTQSGYAVANDTSSILTVSNLVLTGTRLWFNETHGPEAGYFDLTTHLPVTVAYPDDTEAPGRLVAHPSGLQARILTSPASFIDSTPFVKLTVIPDATVVFHDGQVMNNITALENTSQMLVGSFTGPSGSYSAVVTWGDGATSNATFAPAVVNDEGGYDYVLTASHTYLTQGTYGTAQAFITVTNISDANGNGIIRFTATLTDKPLVVTTPTLTNTNGKFFDLSASFTDDIDSTLSWFTATINWGDGETSAGVIVKDTENPGHYFVVATHHKYKKGTWNGSLTIKTYDETSPVPNTVIKTFSVTV